MASPIPIDPSVIAATAKSQPDFVKIGDHGAMKSRTTATASTAIPMTEQSARNPKGTLRCSSNRSGNQRLTKKMSANSSTIEVHQTTVTAASRTRYTFVAYVDVGDWTGKEMIAVARDQTTR